MGSMLELSWGGQKSINLKNGVTRTFLEDEDLVIMSGHAGGRNIRVGFGELSGRVLPSL
jgi:fumarylacetoacetase